MCFSILVTRAVLGASLVPAEPVSTDGDGGAAVLPLLFSHALAMSFRSRAPVRHTASHSATPRPVRGHQNHQHHTILMLSKDRRHSHTFSGLRKACRRFHCPCRRTAPPPPLHGRPRAYAV